MRAFFAAEWLPFALTYGMNHKDFWDSNPAIVNAYVKAYAERYKLEDEKMWTLGNYFFMAAYSAVGKIFCGKTFEPTYPEQPLSRKEQNDDKVLDAKIRKALAAEEAYIREQKRAGLPEIL